MEPLLKKFAGHVGKWLTQPTQDQDVVVSTRIRLARNVQAFPFPARLRNGKSEEVEQVLKKHILSTEIIPGMEYLGLAQSSTILRQTLLERHLISRELVNGKICRGVAFDPTESIAIMVNEEDHLRLQVLRAGFDTTACWNQMKEVDRHLEKGLEYSFSPDYGYLTACPTNVGTGMRVSVMFHLPALSIAEQELRRVFNAAAKTNFAVRGMHGEGTKAIGDFFQISNQVTLGRSESELLDDLNRIVPQIVDFERKVRETLLKSQKHSLEDRVFRAVGILQNARNLSSDEAIGHLSALRLGINLGLVQEWNLDTLNYLLILTQPGHLQARAGAALSPPDRDYSRAETFRKVLRGEKLE